MVDITSGNPLGPDVDGTELSISGQSDGDVLYYNGTAWVRLAKGTALQTLRMNSGATAPEWGVAGSFSLVEDCSDADSSDVTELSVDNLDLDTDGYYDFLAVINNADGGSIKIGIHVNGDSTGSNYGSQTDGGYGSTTQAIGTLNDQPALQNVATGEDVVIEGKIIRGPNGFPYVVGTIYNFSTAGAGTSVSNFCVGYDTAENVTSFELTSNTASAIAQGSKLTVWKRERS